MGEGEAKGEMNGWDMNIECGARRESQRADCTLKSVLLMHSKTSAGVLDCCRHQEATEMGAGGSGEGWDQRGEVIQNKHNAQRGGGGG